MNSWRPRIGVTAAVDHGLGEKLRTYVRRPCSARGRADTPREQNANGSRDRDRLPDHRSRGATGGTCGRASSRSGQSPCRSQALSAAPHEAGPPEGRASVSRGPNGNSAAEPMWLWTLITVPSGSSTKKRLIPQGLVGERIDDRQAEPLRLDVHGVDVGDLDRDRGPVSLGVPLRCSSEPTVSSEVGCDGEASIRKPCSSIATIRPRKSRRTPCSRRGRARRRSASPA